MWHLLVTNLILAFFPLVIRSAWVEIPQVSSNKKSHFAFGSPNFPPPKLTTTTPTNDYKTIMTTPKIVILSTIPAPVSQLKKPRISERKSGVINSQPKKAHIEKVKSPSNNNKTEDEKETPVSYSGFLPLLNSIQQTLIMNAKKSLQSKISLLTNLKDSLLANIDVLMAKLWNPIDATEDDVAEARGHHDEHEMDFPSNEGALLTIGFLTFAVFLIKLVLKLIHALKNKQITTTMMAMTDQTGGTNGGMTTGMTYFGRKKRELEDYNSLRILQYIDEYRFS